MDHELHVACWIHDVEKKLCIHEEEKFVVALSYPRLASKTARSCLKFKATGYFSYHLNETRISVSNN